MTSRPFPVHNTKPGPVEEEGPPLPHLSNSRFEKLLSLLFSFYNPVSRRDKSQQGFYAHFRQMKGVCENPDLTEDEKVETMTGILLALWRGARFEGSTFRKGSTYRTFGTQQQVRERAQRYAHYFLFEIFQGSYQNYLSIPKLQELAATCSFVYQKYYDLLVTANVDRTRRALDETSLRVAGQGEDLSTPSHDDLARLAHNGSSCSRGQRTPD